MNIAEVIVSISNVNIDKVFDYAVNDDMKIQTGTRVVVPFGVSNIKICGYVVGLKNVTDVPLGKLKSVINIIDDSPVISDDMLKVAMWMKERCYTTYAKCLECILPSGIKSRKSMSKTVRFAQIAENYYEDIECIIENYTQKKPLINQGLVLDFLYKNGKTELSEVKECLFVSDSPLNTLFKKGIIVITKDEVKQDIFVDSSAFTTVNNICLNNEQQLAFNHLISVIKSGKYMKSLLHGVTGSGKTEVYLRLIDETVKVGRQAIMLVPEISLTPQTVSRFTSRFGSKVTVTHSKMSLTERYDQWKKALDGEVSIMVGPRSAVFAPFKDLGIIIVDEEHEHSYKSDVTPKYDAREVAEERMKLANGLLLFGTATPSIETYYKAKTGDIELFTLSKRAADNPMPNVMVVDMRDELLNGNRSIFSSLLKEEIENCLKNKEQAILFINRRGYASFVSCRHCGYVITCEDCNVSYTYHKSGEILLCHYCGASIKMPERCPSCESPHIRQFGAGTQKIEQLVNDMFPTAKTLRMDIDTVSGKDSHYDILSGFGQGRADILIGTQMIAKGHDFAGVTLVGIIAADISLNNGDYRSAETTFQLMTQVAGRAGRANLPGKVVAQTYNPEHYAVNHAKTQDYLSFYEEEINIRRIMKYPPFKQLFTVQITGENEKTIVILIHKLLNIMDRYKYRGDYETIGPAPCMVSKIKKRFRWRLIVKSSNEKKLTSFCVYCVNKLKADNDLEGINVNLTLNPTRIE